MRELFWKSAWIALCDRKEHVGYDALSSEEKIWVNVRSLIDSIENGGAISYFYNSGADTLADCLAALDALRAYDVRRQLARVMALFPKGVPPTIEGRNAVINDWLDDDPEKDVLLQEVDDVLMPLVAKLDRELDDFLRRHGLAG